MFSCIEVVHEGTGWYADVANYPQWHVYGRQNTLVMELDDKIGAAKPHDAGLCELLGPKYQETTQGL